MKLTDTHLALLSRATQRDDGALDVPTTLKDREKLVRQMLGVKLVKEVPAGDALPLWRRDEQEGALALVIADKGLEAIGAVAREPKGDNKTAAKPQKLAKRKPKGSQLSRRLKSERSLRNPTSR